MKRNKVVKSLNNSNKNKMKTKATNLQNSNGEPFICKMKGELLGCQHYCTCGSMVETLYSPSLDLGCIPCQSNSIHPHSKDDWWKI